MTGRDTLHAVYRLVWGAAAGILIGFAVFGSRVFDPAQPTSQCVTVSAFLAGVATLVRATKIRHAAVVAAFFAVLQAAQVLPQGWWPAILALLRAGILSAGVLLVALLYHLLAERGYRFGKFLLVGPLLAGVYMAATAAAAATIPGPAILSLWLNLLLGVVIGDAVGLGLEISELTLGRAGPAASVERAA